MSRVKGSPHAASMEQGAGSGAKGQIVKRDP